MAHMEKQDCDEEEMLSESDLQTPSSGRMLALTEFPGGGGFSVSSSRGVQTGPAERGHVRKHQKSSKIGKTIFDIFQHIAQGKTTS